MPHGAQPIIMTLAALVFQLFIGLQQEQILVEGCGSHTRSLISRKSWKTESSAICRKHTLKFEAKWIGLPKPPGAKERDKEPKGDGVLKSLTVSQTRFSTCMSFSLSVEKCFWEDKFLVK